MLPVTGLGAVAVGGAASGCPAAVSAEAGTLHRPGRGVVRTTERAGVRGRQEARLLLPARGLGLMVVGGSVGVVPGAVLLTLGIPSDGVSADRACVRSQAATK